MSVPIDIRLKDLYLTIARLEQERDSWKERAEKLDVIVEKEKEN